MKLSFKPTILSVALLSCATAMAQQQSIDWTDKAVQTQLTGKYYGLFSQPIPNLQAATPAPATPSTWQEIPGTDPLNPATPQTAATMLYGVEINVAKNGKFTGKLTTQFNTASFKGTFNPSGEFSGVTNVPVKVKNEYGTYNFVYLSLRLTGYGAVPITGATGNVNADTTSWQWVPNAAGNQNISGIAAYVDLGVPQAEAPRAVLRKAKYSRRNAAPQTNISKTYNFVFDKGASWTLDDTGKTVIQPEGYANGTATLNNVGSIRMLGYTASGVRFSKSALITESFANAPTAQSLGDFPFTAVVSNRGAKEQVLGQFSFGDMLAGTQGNVMNATTGLPTFIMRGLTRQTRSARVNGTFYAAGYNIPNKEGIAVAYKNYGYVNFQYANILPVPDNAIINFDGPDDKYYGPKTNPIIGSRSFSLQDRGRFVFPGTTSERLTGSMKPATNSFSGTYQNYYFNLMRTADAADFTIFPDAAEVVPNLAPKIYPLNQAITSVTIPRGTKLVYPLNLPAGTSFTGGLPMLNGQPFYPVNADPALTDATLAATTYFPAGTVFTGEVIVPNYTSLGGSRMGLTTPISPEQILATGTTVRKASMRSNFYGVGFTYSPAASDAANPLARTLPFEQGYYGVNISGNQAGNVQIVNNPNPSSSNYEAPKVRFVGFNPSRIPYRGGSFVVEVTAPAGQTYTIEYLTNKNGYYIDGWQLPANPTFAGNLDVNAGPQTFLIENGAWEQHVGTGLPQQYILSFSVYPSGTQFPQMDNYYTVNIAGKTINFKQSWQMMPEDIRVIQAVVDPEAQATGPVFINRNQLEADDAEAGL